MSGSMNLKVGLLTVEKPLELQTGVVNWNCQLEAPRITREYIA
jgi:hypothetical protein